MSSVTQSRTDEYYRALLERDSRYLGTFVVGVTSTGIFCLPTCRARKPKAENCRFFPDSGAALRAGFRPCRVCRPTEDAGTPPPGVREALQLARTAPEEPLHDADLRRRGWSPEVIRRWCRRNLGMTFHAYRRMVRINEAYRGLARGVEVTDAAFESGYESLSGFGSAFRSVLADSPSAAAGGTVNVLSLDRLTTPLGPMMTVTGADGLYLLEFTDRRGLERELADLTRRASARIVPGRTEHGEAVAAQLAEYFAGTRRAFEVPLRTPGSPFQRAVWDQLRRIPYGETRSYADQARALGRPSAVRAVARANGQNRLAIVIPCHRVIGSDGSLTGYAGGLTRKRWLLEHEGAR